MQAAAVAITGAVLLAVLVVRTVSRERPSLPPAAVAALSFQFSLMPTMATECAHGGCTNETASDQDVASLRRFLGATFRIQGDRVRDRYGVTQARFGGTAHLRGFRGWPTVVESRHVWGECRVNYTYRRNALTQSGLVQNPGCPRR